MAPYNVPLHTGLQIWYNKQNFRYHNPQKNGTASVPFPNNTVICPRVGQKHPTRSAKLGTSAQFKSRDHSKFKCYITQWGGGIWNLRISADQRYEGIRPNIMRGWGCQIALKVTINVNVGLNDS